MKKNRKAQVATLALLLAAAGLALVRNRPSPSAAQEPQDTVYAMLNAVPQSLGTAKPYGVQLPIKRLKPPYYP
jgi:ABC-type oligopeptide transport system substrate-binding subunit